ncbi:hypothetical protein A5889_000014 [Enterococcus sp. 9D6_DIV0238]|uniref:Helix-turn-helix conjugative transposon-like domain-containing protein n=2 Tax=Candidatus Enterococcus dunnyi TaxID=1834192 RepID=A0AAQ3VYS8_9ENTE
METLTTLALKAQKGDHEAMVYFYQLFHPLLLKESKRAGEFNNILGFKYLLAFFNKENKFCGADQANDWYHVIIAKYHLKRITLHEFRKTHVTLCAWANMSLENVIY